MEGLRGHRAVSHLEWGRARSSSQAPETQGSNPKSQRCFLRTWVTSQASLLTNQLCHMFLHQATKATCSPTGLAQEGVSQSLPGD